MVRFPGKVPSPSITSGKYFRMSSLHVMVLGVSSSCESSCSLGWWLTWLMSAWLAMSFDPSTMCSRPGWGVIRWSLRTSSHESRTLPSWFVMLNVIGSGLRPGYFMNTCKLPQVCDRLSGVHPHGTLYRAEVL